MNSATPLRSAAAVVALSVTALARANEATGTEAVGQMQVSGSTLALMVAALVGLGVVVWLVSKVVSR